MAGKRQATSDLNHDNWDREEEPEERGTFRTANEDELKNRVIKKARRKIAPSSVDAADDGTATKSVFSGFSGFGKSAPSTAISSSSFSFLTKIPASTATAPVGGGIAGTSAATTSSVASFSFGISTTTSTAISSVTPKSTMPFGVSATVAKAVGSNAATFSFGGASTTTDKNEFTSAVKSQDYYAKLKALNQAVSEWIKTHVDKNPLCILTPIFKDYEKYLKELEHEKANSDSSLTAEKYSKKDTTSLATSETGENAKAASTPKAATFSFASSVASSSSSEAVGKTNGFSFGLKKPEEIKDSKPEASSAVSTPSFSFGIKPSSSTKTTSTGFSFGKPAATVEEGSAPKPFSFVPGGTPFSFGNIKPPEASTTTTNANDDDDEEPPKNEFKQVVEEDAVYSKKCKVFVKKDGNFVDKGVGTLYLKPIESNGKTQLLVRADTNLGNILVNLILSSGIPSQRMGKNNVMLVCLPTPDVEKPTPMLLRVKTSEEADELLENIDKYKK